MRNRFVSNLWHFISVYNWLVNGLAPPTGRRQEMKPGREITTHDWFPAHRQIQQLWQTGLVPAKITGKGGIFKWNEARMRNYQCRLISSTEATTATRTKRATTSHYYRKGVFSNKMNLGWEKNHTVWSWACRQSLAKWILTIMQGTCQEFFCISRFIW